jgi:ribosomal-protein-alanine N-acetyltransferase
MTWSGETASTRIRALRACDAAILFPLVFQSPVTRNLVWDGPASLQEYCESVADFAERTSRGEMHMFAIVDATTGRPAGSIGVRPYTDGFRGDVGLWLGEPFQGRGHGTAAIHLASRYAFECLGLAKLEAAVFTGNYPSRRAFEKNRFRCEGTIRHAVRKQGILVDEWLMGLLREEMAS